MEELYIQNAAFDKPDPRDRNFSDVLKAGVEAGIEKKEFPKRELRINNQGADYLTRNACTQAGLLNISNAQNILEYTEFGLPFDQRELKPIWVEYNMQRDPADRWEGDRLQNALNWFVKIGLIKGYAKINSIEEAKQAIDRGNYIYTGSSNGDRAYVREEGKYRKRSDDKFVGHAFVGGVEYGTTYCIGINSYGPDNGLFKIPWDLWDSLYTKYAIFDKSDKDIIDAYLASNEFARRRLQCMKLGITNGDEPERNITRGEMMVMLGRMRDLLN